MIAWIISTQGSNLTFAVLCALALYGVPVRWVVALTITPAPLSRLRQRRRINRALNTGQGRNIPLSCPPHPLTDDTRTVYRGCTEDAYKAPP